LINPVVVKAKILLQQIWLLKLDWDKPVPEEIATTWKLFVDELTELNKFRIPRKLIIRNLPINLIELRTRRQKLTALLFMSKQPM
jgi:hypothetical protein